jgi:hypothetical protein
MFSNLWRRETACWSAITLAINGKPVQAQILDTDGLPASSPANDRPVDRIDAIEMELM